MEEKVKLKLMAMTAHLPAAGAFPCSTPARPPDSSPSPRGGPSRAPTPGAAASDGERSGHLTRLPAARAWLTRLPRKHLLLGGVRAPSWASCPPRPPPPPGHPRAARLLSSSPRCTQPPGESVRPRALTSIHMLRLPDPLILPPPVGLTSTSHFVSRVNLGPPQAATSQPSHPADDSPGSRWTPSPTRQQNRALPPRYSPSLPAAHPACGAPGRTPSPSSPVTATTGCASLLLAQHPVEPLQHRSSHLETLTRVPPHSAEKPKALQRPLDPA